MELQDFAPRSQIVCGVEPHVHTPSIVIDSHVHLDHEFGGGWVARPATQLIDVMDQSGVQTIVDLDGGWSEEVLNRHLDKWKSRWPDRFQMFGGVDWTRWPELGNRFSDWAAARIRLQASRGAQGVKIWKPLGLTVRDEHDQRVAIDDPRLDPIWSVAADLDLPIVIHSGDPAAYFAPMDRFNERYQDIAHHPEWHVEHLGVSLQSVLDEMLRMIAANAKTIFVCAHVGCFAENLSWVGQLLESFPNVYIDVAERVDELSRQPHSTRRLVEAHPSRILFGSDLPPSVETYRLLYSFYGSQIEDLEGPNGCLPGVSWRLTGLDLSASFLNQFYYENARQVFRLAT